MVRTSLELWELVLAMGRSNHKQLIISLGQEANGTILGCLCDLL